VLLGVTGGRVSLLGLWFAATALMARRLGPDAFGLYGLCQNVIKIITGCVGDPLDMAVMREAPVRLRSDRPRAIALVRSAFWLRVLFGLVPIVFAAAMPWAASYLIFRSTDYRQLAVLTACGVLGDFFLRSALGFFQVSEAFARFIAVDIVWQAGRAIVVVGLVATGTLSATTAVLVYVAAPYVAFAVAIFLLPRDVLRPAPPHRQHVREILHYGKWIAAALAMSAVYERLDLILLDWFRDKHDVGVYAGAMLLASVPDFLNGAIQTVLSPKVAPAFAAGTFGRLQSRYLRASIPIGAGVSLIAVTAAGPVIRTFLAGGYVESIPAFRLLILGTMFELIATPLPAALVNFVAPRRMTAITSIGLVVVFVGGVILIPRYGVTGAAALILSARVAVGTAVVVLARRLGVVGKS
jgi:O-antigen/teichoic acid export membrane protein